MTEPLFAQRWEPREPSGEATPIVLFHDSLGCVELWRDFPAALAAATGQPVVAYDRLGFGRSPAHPGPPDLDFIAGEARSGFPALCDQLGIEAFIGFGHSVGGGMALHCAAQHPDRCVAVVTEAAQAFVEDRTTAGIREAKAGFLAPGGLARLERYHGDKARWVLDAWTETWLSAAFADWSLDAVLPEVRCPVLALHGELDEYGSTAHPERIAALAGGPASAEILAGAHHVPHRERQDEVLTLTRRFLASC
ncbi:MAG: alpha/beta hydrolase [Solirubrobacteraceae bacterium]|nr:alpha/beta hydrolase [Solirubrobacteraceae bacterium]